MNQSGCLFLDVSRGIIVMHLIYSFCMAEQCRNIFLWQQLVENGRNRSADPVDGAIFNTDGIASSSDGAADLAGSVTFSVLFHEDEIVIFLVIDRFTSTKDAE